MQVCPRSEFECIVRYVQYSIPGNKVKAGSKGSPESLEKNKKNLDAAQGSWYLNIVEKQAEYPLSPRHSVTGRS